MLGGTTFNFDTEGIEAALVREVAAAGDADIKIGCGVETVRQFVLASHVDKIYLAGAVVPPRCRMRVLRSTGFARPTSVIPHDGCSTPKSCGGSSNILGLMTNRRRRAVFLI